MKACPQCKTQFPDAAEFCPEHGVKLLAAAGAAVAVVGSAALKADPLEDTGYGPPPKPPAEFAAPVPLIPPKPPNEYDDLIGTTIDGRYFLEKKLGEGGMGLVFKAHHTLIEKPVAVKVLKKQVARDKQVVQRFLQEAKAASRIGHPGIVDVTDFGQLPDGSTYSVMEFIDGATLAKALRDGGPMQAARALPIAVQIARALAAAHEKRIVHRDLKPENIFVTTRNGRSDFVKVVDFGIAKVAPANDQASARLTRAGAVFGTPEYMAPEQAAGRSDNDHRVDVYALGTILYEMLVGKVPLKGETLMATIAMQMLDPITPPREANPKADITPELEAVIMKALAKERDERYASMADLIEGIEAVAGGVPIEWVGTGSTATRRPTTGALTPVKAGADAPTLAPQNTPSQPRIESAAPPPKKSKALLFGLIGIVVIGGSIAAYAVATRGGGATSHSASVSGSGEPDETTGPAVAVVPDAAVLAVVVPDASPIAVVVPDASLAPLDGGLVAEAPLDAGLVASVDPKNPHDPKNPTNLPIDPTEGPPVNVIVKTKPAGAALFVKGDPAGTDGTTFTRATGTKLSVRCTMAGYEAGVVAVTFDGSATEAVCKLRKKPKCTRDLKNPFDECPQ